MGDVLPHLLTFSWKGLNSELNIGGSHLHPPYFTLQGVDLTNIGTPVITANWFTDYNASWKYQLSHSYFPGSFLWLCVCISPLQCSVMPRLPARLSFGDEEWVYVPHQGHLKSTSFTPPFCLFATDLLPWNPDSVLETTVNRLSIITAQF